MLEPSQPPGGCRSTIHLGRQLRPGRDREEISFFPDDRRRRHEVSYPSYEGVVCARESIDYILRLGVDNIRSHSRELARRLQEELPPRGYQSITPKGNESPILAFTAPDPEGAMAACRKNAVHIAMRFGNRMRLSPSVYNNHDDIDRLFEALP